MKIIPITLSALLPVMLLCHVHATSWIPNPNRDDIHTTHLGEAKIGPQHRVKRDDKVGVYGSSYNPDQSEEGAAGKNGVNEQQYESEGDESGQSENGPEDGQYDDNDGTADKPGSTPPDYINKQKFLDNYVKDSSALNKLLSESTDLAREIGAVFELIGNRETEVMEEMRGLKEALNKAVVKLKNSIVEDDKQGNKKLQRFRRQFDNKNPYRACVSIESVNDNLSTNPNPNGMTNTNRPPNFGPKIQEYIPGKSDPVLDRDMVVEPPPPRPRSQSHPQHPEPPGAGGVDLKEVYWLRLDPRRTQEQLHEKVNDLLKEKQSAGRDVLVIPVSHNYKSTDEVKDGFLRAVHVRPEALKSNKLRKIRSLRIMEI